MAITVEYNKFVLGGIAKDLEIVESMKFVDWADACDWASRCTKSEKVPFVITEMRGPNGEVEKFECI